MPIEIRRVNDGYEARVTPPHGNGSAWETKGSLPIRELIAALEQLGCHQTDIGDALYDADPEWQIRLSSS